MQTHHKKNVETRKKKVVVEVNTYCRYCPNFSQCWEVFIYLVEGCCWAFGSLDGVLE